MFDPLIVIGIGFLGSVVGGPLLVAGLERLPQEWRHLATWLVILGSVACAIVADLASQGPVAGSIVYLLAVLPGLITFVAFRMLVASAFISLLPLYFVVTSLTRQWPTYVPELPLDRLVAVQPAWTLVYGSLYLFIGVLPLMVVRERELIRRAAQSYLAVMLVAFAGFVVYPTAAPRPAAIANTGFAAWSLRLVYDLDPPYGCFPSLHVAWAFVSALTCYRVHRGVGAVAAFWAALIGASTLFTKQHYLLDVIAGASLAFVAYGIFLQPYPRGRVPEADHRRAPYRAAAVVAIWAVVVAGFWMAYRSAWLAPGI